MFFILYNFAVLNAPADGHDCHIFIFDTSDALDSSRATLQPMANINVGLEPVSYCVLSPNRDVVLSCDEDGQVRGGTSWRPIMTGGGGNGSDSSQNMSTTTMIIMINYSIDIHQPNGEDHCHIFK